MSSLSMEDNYELANDPATTAPPHPESLLSSGCCPWLINRGGSHSENETQIFIRCHMLPYNKYDSLAIRLRFSMVFDIIYYLLVCLTVRLL